MSDSLLRFAGQVEIQAAAGARVPTVSIVGYTGGLMTVPGWGPVALDLQGLDIAAQVPILSDHDASLRGIVGHGQAANLAGQLMVNGTLPQVTEAAKQIVELAKGGFTFQASVGVQPRQQENIGAGKSATVNGKTITAGASGFTLIRSGTLKEISIVALGADSDTSVAIAAHTKGTRMSTETNTVEIPEELKATWDKTGLTDSQRVLARWSGAKFREPGIKEQTEQFLHAALAGSLTFADFDREILRAENRDLSLHMLRASYPKAPEMHGSSRDAATSGDTLQASLLCHLGAENVAVKAFGDRVTQQARDARHGSLVEIMQAAFMANGQEPPRNRNDLIKAMFSTSSTANIVSGAQNKILMDQWQRLPMTWPALCKQVSAVDFKQGKAVRLVGRNTMMEELPNAGTIKHGHLQDSAATYQLATYARMYAITRQDIINDDLGAFNELPRVIARGAGLKMESVFWTLVLANAGSFFSEANGNLIDAPLALAGLGTAVATMRKLVDADGEPVLVEPKTLVVCPELETVADSLYASTNIVMAGTAAAVTTQPAASTYANKYKPLVAPYVSNANYTGQSDTLWFLFGDPNAGPAAFLAAFLNGQTLPTIEQASTDFDTLGIQYRGYVDFGFSQCDKEGAVMSSGDGT